MILLACLATFAAGVWTALTFLGNGMGAPSGPFRGRGGLIAVWTLAALLWLAWGADRAMAHDHGRTDQNWEEMSDEERDWIVNLRRPDDPAYSCCGLADQYWCDGIKVDGDGVFCQITDDRDDKRFNRPHVPLGTWIEIPPNKLKWDKGNPTGHSIVFMNAARLVYCFVQASGT